MKPFPVTQLPPTEHIESVKVLKQTATAHRYLAELKGTAKTIPNQSILLNTLPLIEAKDSSAIENIVTTHDEIYKAELFDDAMNNASAKEVRNYTAALRIGLDGIQKDGVFTIRHILKIQECIKNNMAGLRTAPGTELKHQTTGETVYIPPQNHDEIISLMGNLEKFMNDESVSELDTLVKMAVLHYQFESIHPFYDGNGRTGRIINILYLVYKELLDIPILYLSNYIIRHKAQYYTLLQEVRDKNNWEEWVLFMLAGVAETARSTIELINSIRTLMQKYKIAIRTQYKFYSQDLLNSLFSLPYTKIDYLSNALHIHRQTAAKYLNALADGGFLKLVKMKNIRYYVHEELFNIFTQY